MSEDKPGCTCGGCGTNTTCATTNKEIPEYHLYITAYAAPIVQDWQPPAPPIGTTTGQPHTQEETPEALRLVLLEELLRDLLKRVQELEQQVKLLRAPTQHT